MSNQINLPAEGDIPPDIEAQMNAALDTLETLSAAYVRSLTNAERASMPKMGNDSVEFVQNAINAVDHSLDFMPRSFEPEPLKINFKTAQQLSPFVMRLQSLARGLSDGEMFFGSLAYTAGLDVYDNLGKGAEKDSTLLAFYNAMKVRFFKLRGKQNPTPDA